MGSAMTTAFDSSGGAIRLEIVEVDPAVRTAWQDDGLKLERYMATGSIVRPKRSSLTSRPIRAGGRSVVPRMRTRNRLAWLRALQAQLLLA